MLRVRLVVATAVALSCCMASAQLVHRSNEVNGMSGTVNILPNRNATHTTVVFTSNTPLSATSNQIVFVLQAENTALPPAWDGPAKVLTGDGFIAIIPEQNPGQRYLFKFADREVPPSLSKQSFQVFEIVGIARYGEQRPLTSEEIMHLAATGRTCSSGA